MAGLASWVLFVSNEDDLTCAQATGTLTPSDSGTTYSPASITFGAQKASTETVSGGLTRRAMDRPLASSTGIDILGGLESYGISWSGQTARGASRRREIA